MQTVMEMIKANEGSNIKNGRHMPYLCPEGKQTVAYGRNLEDNGLSEQEAETLLWNDIQRTIGELFKTLPFFEGLSTNRQNVLVDMNYNLGLTRFMGFKKMIAALKGGDYYKAADEMLDSTWAQQVKSRATRNAKMMREG